MQLRRLNLRLKTGSPVVEKKSLNELLVVSPVECWRAWIREICADEGMDQDRVMRHIQTHVASHMPNVDAPLERWTEWIAGCYNLLAILGHMTGCAPEFQAGVDLLFRKWSVSPSDHTPPPKRATKERAAKVASAKRQGGGS